jgi:hypothetical protein
MNPPPAPSAFVYTAVEYGTLNAEHRKGSLWLLGSGPSIVLRSVSTSGSVHVTFGGVPEQLAE